MHYQILTQHEQIPVISGEDLTYAEDFDTLVGLRVKYCISLQMGYLDVVSPSLRNYEAINCLNRGIIPLHIMMSDFTCPTYEQLKTVLEFIKNANGGVYFHCRRGKDRTGMVRALYRMNVQSWSYKESCKEMNDLGHAKFPYFWWQSRLLKYSNKYIADTIDNYFNFVGFQEKEPVTEKEKTLKMWVKWKWDQKYKQSENNDTTRCKK